MHISMKLFVMLSLLALTQAKIHRMTIHKDPNAINTMGKLFGMKEYIAKKHNLDLSAYAPCTEEIDTYNASYYGYIYIGTPPQQVKVVFDTALSDVIVLSTQYDPSNSSTALSMDGSYAYYLDDPMTGEYSEPTSLYTDVIAVGDLIVPSQTIAIFDGGIGEYARIGLGAFGPNPQFESFIQNLNKTGLISSEMFSMYLVNELSYGTPQFAGEIIFGGSDSTAYNGTLNYVDINPSGSYGSEIQIDDVSVLGKSVAKNVMAIVDSGSDFIVCPILPFAMINKQLGGYIDANGNYIIDCLNLHTLPTIDITLGGEIMSLKPSAYILNIMGDDGNAKCVSAFTLTQENYWILGAPVFANNYLEFDFTNRKIGWAPAAPYSGPTSVNVPPEPVVPLPKKICKSS